MSFKQFLCYSVICDGCGKDSNAGEEIAGWLGKAEAEDVAFSDAAGKLTSAAVQILGLSKPTQALTDWGFKTANRYFEAAKLGKVATNSKSLERATKEALRLNQLSGKQKV